MTLSHSFQRIMEIGKASGRRCFFRFNDTPGSLKKMSINNSGEKIV
jgi:hypothetical protein